MQSLLRDTKGKMNKSRIERERFRDGVIIACIEPEYFFYQVYIPKEKVEQEKG